jgi:UDP-galactopyranose mutase
MVDYLIVGAGFSGCTLAERIASELGRTVLLIDREGHLGGLSHDYHNAHGILVHYTGLHIVHTNSDEVVSYLSRFTGWQHTRPEMRVLVDGRLLPFPVNIDTANALFGTTLATREEAQAFFSTLAEPVASAENAEDMALRKAGALIYQKIFRGYTLKWYGVDPRRLDRRVTSRIRLRPTHETHYQDDRFQAVPSPSYASMFANMVAHPKISVSLNTEFQDIRDTVRYRTLIFTGSLDEFFGFRYGRLPYRHMEFVQQTYDVTRWQPCHQVNYPNDHSFMRTFEFKHATGQVHPKTTIVREYPTDALPGLRPDYPMLLPEARLLFLRYRRDADALRGVHFLGRLPDYRYYTIGQSVARALTYFRMHVANAARKRTAEVTSCA